MWFTPAWAATVKPTISAVAAMLKTAVIQRRTRRVIAASFTRFVPCSGITGGSKSALRQMGLAAGHGRGGDAQGTTRGPRRPRPRRSWTPPTWLPGGIGARPLAWPHREVDGRVRAACPGGRVTAAAIAGSALPRGRPAAVHAGCPAHHRRGRVPGVRADPLVARCRAGLARAGASADRRGLAGWLAGRRGRPPTGATGRAAADFAV